MAQKTKAPSLPVKKNKMAVHFALVNKSYVWAAILLSLPACVVYAKTNICLSVSEKGKYVCNSSAYQIAGFALVCNTSQTSTQNRYIFFMYRYCCSDWKILALVYGLNAACSKFFCIWCFCTKDKINDLDGTYASKKQVKEH